MSEERYYGSNTGKVIESETEDWLVRSLCQKVYSYHKAVCTWKKLELEFILNWNSMNHMFASYIRIGEQFYEFDGDLNKLAKTFPGLDAALSPILIACALDP